MIENLLLISIQASVLILAVLVLRLFLNKTHKRFTYFMWMLVLIRLCLPIQIESQVGLFSIDNGEQAIESIEKNDSADNSADSTPDSNVGNNINGVSGTVTDNMSNNNETNNDMNYVNGNSSNAVIGDNVDKVPDEGSASESDTIMGGIADVLGSETESNNVKNPIDGKTNVNETSLEIDTELIVMIVWIAGMVVVASLALLQLFMLKKRLRFAINTSDNIWETDELDTAFVIGIFRAKIYIPTNITESERQHIISHEKMHIKHGDHMVRVVMLLANIVYWWNPIVWVATHFMKKDMEMLCDESVIRDMGDDKRKEYLTTLLHCSAKNSGIIPVMSFGETNTENRIRHIINLREPKLYIILVLAIFVVACVTCCTEANKGDASLGVLDNQDNEGLNEDVSNKNDDENDGVINTEPLGNQNNTNTNVNVNSTISNKNENLPFECGTYMATDVNNPRHMVIDQYFIKILDTTKFWEGYTADLEGIYYYKYFYYDVKDGVINVYTNIKKDTIAFQMNVVDEFTIEFDGKTYCNNEKLNEKEIVYNLKYGVYLPEDKDCNLYITIDKFWLYVFDITKFNNNRTVDYYLNSGERFRSDDLDVMTINGKYDFYNEYDYKISGNKILATRITIRDVIKLFILDDDTIEYNGVKYVHKDKSNRSDNFVISKTGYEQYDKLIERLTYIYNNCNEDEKYDAIAELNIADTWNYESAYRTGGFYLIDLDGNGVKELLLGTNDISEVRGDIYDIYTIVDEQLVKIDSGGQRYRFRLCENNIIINEGSSGAANRHFEISKCNGDKLELIKYLDMSDCYYVDGQHLEGGYTELDENYKIKRYLTEEEFFNTIYSYTCIPIEFTLFETMVK